MVNTNKERNADKTEIGCTVLTPQEKCIKTKLRGTMIHQLMLFRFYSVLKKDKDLRAGPAVH